MKLNIEGFQQLDIEAETVGKIAALCNRVIVGVADNNDADSVANVILEKALDAALEAIKHPSDWDVAKLRFVVAKTEATAEDIEAVAQDAVTAPTEALCKVIQHSFARAAFLVVEDMKAGAKKAASAGGAR